MSWHFARHLASRPALGRVSAGYSLAQLEKSDEERRRTSASVTRSANVFRGVSSEQDSASDSSDDSSSEQTLTKEDKLVKTTAGGCQLLFARETLECVLDVSKKLAQDPETQAKIMAALDESWEIVDVPGGMTVPVFPAPEDVPGSRRIQSLDDEEDSDSSVFDTDLSDSDIDRICIVPGNLELGLQLLDPQQDEMEEVVEMEVEEVEEEDAKDPHAPEETEMNLPRRRSPTENVRPSATLMSKAAEWMQTALRALLRTIRDSTLMSTEQQSELPEHVRRQRRRQQRSQITALISSSGQKGRWRRRQIPRHIVQSHEFKVAALAGAAMILLWLRSGSPPPKTMNSDSSSQK